LNEGNFFSGSVEGLNLTGQAQDSRLDDFIRGLFIDNTTLTQTTFSSIHALYRENDTSLGEPFNTGDSLFDRAAAFYTDAMFLGPRRLFFEHGSDLQPMFAYHFREFIPGSDVTLGGKALFLPSVSIWLIILFSHAYYRTASHIPNASWW
jgi:hypothetical protein